MIKKLWEVRSTNTTVLRTYVMAHTREDAKRIASNRQWEEVNSTEKLTANQVWYSAFESAVSESKGGQS